MVNELWRKWVYLDKNFPVIPREQMSPEYWSCCWRSVG